MNSRTIGNVTVTRTRIIGTSLVFYAAWEPFAGHTTMTFGEDYGITGRLGKVSTEPLPDSIRNMNLKPMSEERYRVVTAWRTEKYQRAYNLILAAYPEAANGRPDYGEIECREPKESL